MEGTSISEGVGCLADLAPLLTWTFLGPALVGYIPFVLTTTAPEILHLSSVLGSGLLVGTVMETIIPEAYNMLLLNHQEQEERNIEHRRNLNTGHPSHLVGGDNGHRGGGAGGGGEVPGEFSSSGDTEESQKKELSSSLFHQTYYEASHFAGLATALGFLFMLLCDRIPNLVTKIRRRKHHQSIESGVVVAQTTSGSKDGIEMGNILHNSHGHHELLHHHHHHHHHERKQSSKSAFTNSSAASVSFGLILHSAMDGIPLGAAACSGNQDVQLVLMLATLLHKAPASFGLSSFLLGSGAPRRIVLRSLGYFCLAAPFTALVVALALSVWKSSSSGVLTTVLPATATTTTTTTTTSTTNSGISSSPLSDREHLDAAAMSSALTGLGLLFSAGTMIYTITTHLLPELLKKSPHHHPPESRDMKDCKIEDNDKDEDPTVLQVLELCTFVLGLMVPFAIEIIHGGHAHGHRH